MSCHLLGVFFTLGLLVLPDLSYGCNYSETLSFHNSKLGEGSYSPQIRPKINQTDVLEVGVMFELVSIVNVDDVTQSFTCNGFMFFVWTDELLTWNETLENLPTKIHPFPENIWRPRVILLNTLGDRDLFEDDNAPVFVNSGGGVTWVPGSLFPTSCELNMSYYPFDVQTCVIRLVAMTFSTKELIFTVRSSGVKLTYFTQSGEWDVKKTEMTTADLNASSIHLSSINITFVLRRRPTFFLLNVLLPVVFLAFLNIFVFVIPAESGEKIGYGITVLLALSLYMSTVSGMLPKSSLTLPYVIIYLFILLILSMITVISSIIVVFLHNMEEKEETHQRVQTHFANAITKVTLLRRAITAMGRRGKESNFSQPPINTISVQPGTLPKSDVIPTEENRETKRPKVNKYKVIGRHINVILFSVFLVIYIAVTLGFILIIALSQVS